MDASAPPDEVSLTGRRWWLGVGLVLTLALLATVPTTGDIGLTWDEPSYRTSQLVSAEWWGRLAAARSGADLAALLTPDALAFYWPYARYGYNFHPPLAGQLNLLTSALFGGWVRDIPARRLATVFEYAATITLLFGFLARRYGSWVGGIAAGSLLLMPRVYGDGHIAGTDTPGLLLWAVASLAFWKGLTEPNARTWRVVVGVALGLSFLEKMAAVAVLGPILGWLAVTRLPRLVTQPGARATLIDSVVTGLGLLIPLGLAYAEVRRLARLYPPPAVVSIYDLPASGLPGVILFAPLLVWTLRRLAARVAPTHPVWGAERPGLETLASIAAFAPAVAYLGNPGWWLATLPRLAHYYQISADRQGALPDIQILYLGQIYSYSLPWTNGWVLIGVTVPASILLAGVVGLLAGLHRMGRTRDALPVYFAAQLAFLPVVRMLPTPAHDGVRLMLPTFFFVAAFAGWGAWALANASAQGTRSAIARRWVVALVVLAPAAYGLVRIHPYELSYYNELIGGPPGAWRRGFELSYWYEAFDGATLSDLNRVLPRDAAMDSLNDFTNPPTFACLQELGRLRGDITLGSPDPNQFPFAWLLTHDSKATPLTRLLFAMEPYFASRPSQLDQLRVVTIVAPATVARAWALDLLTRGSNVVAGSAPPRAPLWVRGWPVLARLWGDGLTLGPPLRVDPTLLDWARTDPAGFRAAAGEIAQHPDARPAALGPPAARLREMLNRRIGRTNLGPDRLDWRTTILLRVRPQALAEAAQILTERPEAVRRVLLHPGYLDPAEVGGFLDRGITDR